jgi:hypothetical protein
MPSSHEVEQAHPQLNSTDQGRSLDSDVHGRSSSPSSRLYTVTPDGSDTSGALSNTAVLPRSAEYITADDPFHPAGVVMVLDRDEAIDLSEDTDTALMPQEVHDSAASLRSFVANYNTTLPVLSVINNDTVECCACSRTQRLNNPFRICRSALRPNLFLQSIQQHCSSISDDGGPGAHTRNVMKFAEFLKSQPRLPFVVAAPRHQVDPTTVTVTCLGYKPGAAVRIKMTVSVSLTKGGRKQQHTVSMDPYILKDELHPTRKRNGVLVWYFDPKSEAYRHGYILHAFILTVLSVPIVIARMLLYFPLTVLQILPCSMCTSLRS